MVILQNITPPTSDTPNEKPKLLRDAFAKRLVWRNISHLSLEIVFSFGTFPCDQVCGGVYVPVVNPRTWGDAGNVKYVLRIRLISVTYYDFSTPGVGVEGLSPLSDLTL